MFLTIQVDYARLSQEGAPSIATTSSGWELQGLKGVKLFIRRRTAPPATYCSVTQDGAVIFGYGERGEHHLTDEFLECRLERDGRLEIRRDVHCTLPLLYAFHDGCFTLSNDHTAVAPSLPEPALNLDVFVHWLAAKDHHRRTLHKGLYPLDELQKLRVTPRGVELIQPTGRAWSNSFEAQATNPRHFFDALEASFEALVEERLPHNAAVAFEASGGLDSSTLPLWMAKRYPDIEQVAVSLLYPGDDATTQLSKLTALQKITNAQQLTVPLVAGKNHPLSRFNKGGSAQYSPIQSFTEVYKEPTQQLARLLADQGVQTIVTGIGGDELFENRLSLTSQLGFGSETRKEHLKESPPYVTESYMRQLAASVLERPHRPLWLLSQSVHATHSIRNNTYIEHGIWPVSQFGDPYLYEFCQGLPIQYRANKNILRAYYQARGFPELIFNPDRNEDFNTFFNESFFSRQYDRLFEDLAAQSEAIRLGFIDQQQLRVTYHRAVGHQDPTWLFALYCWMCAEIAVRAGV